MLNTCLGTELISSRMLRPQGSCSFRWTCQGHISQPGTKHAHCLCSAVCTRKPEQRVNSRKEKPLPQLPQRGGFRQDPNENWLLPLLKHHVSEGEFDFNSSSELASNCLQKPQCILDRHGESYKPEENASSFSMEGKHQSILF